MEKAKLDKAKEIENHLNIINKYLDRFNPDNNTVWLHVKDHYGNGNLTLDLYYHGNDNSEAIGYKNNNLTKHYKEFLQKCTNDLLIRKKELEEEFDKL